MTTDPRGSYRVRASDGEREEFAKILRAAMSEGRLTLEEGEERLAKVYAATFRDELGPLTADLPDGGRQAAYDDPELQARFTRGVRRHVSLAAIAAGVLVGLWVLSGAHFFWPLIPLLFLWFGVVRHLRWRRWARWGGGPWGGHRFGGPGWGGRGPGWGGGPGGSHGGWGGGWRGEGHSEGHGEGWGDGWGSGSGHGTPPWARGGGA